MIGDSIFTVLLWTVVLCAVFGVAAFVADHIEGWHRFE